MFGIFQKFFGSANDRLVKKYLKTVEEINALEPQFKALSDAELKQKTSEFKERLSKGETLDDLMKEAFGVVREVAHRVLGERHYDVQLVGGIGMHNGTIVEMRTGEGKTLMSTAPLYLNALSGKGVHVVTVNDYLAERDSEWMGKVFKFLDLSVGCILANMSDEERRKAYAADITYATNNELGFDYLRDNMKFNIPDMVQRGFSFAIIDEVDSILIDEARTPLIISGPAEDSTAGYLVANKYIPMLTEKDYEKDEKSKGITLTEAGSAKIEELLEKDDVLGGASLYDIQNIGMLHHINQALKAHKMYHRDVDYMVHNGKVLIIDEFTGRTLDGRRYSDGLHQAIEAKEGARIEVENQTLASITYQNYFRMYDKLAGMSGTVETEAQEFFDIYKLNIIVIPTHRPLIRKDLDDEVYRTNREKLNAIVKLIKERHALGQPILVGTASIEKSEEVSLELQKEGLPHNVLNARYHDKEADIIAKAGYVGGITVATNMAGRGTDIKLGGNFDLELETTLKDKGAEISEAEKEKIGKDLKILVKSREEEVKKLGGLCVIATERHESRRIDNQLRGRSGRQGDPGETKFFLSLEDDLMRIFGSERLDGMLQRLGLKEGEAISHSWVNKALERAQKKVEARNYDIRKHLLKYDDVMNDQRKIIYEQRKEIMSTASLKESIDDMRLDVLETIFDSSIPAGSSRESWDVLKLHEEVRRIFSIDAPLQKLASAEGNGPNEIYALLKAMVLEKVEAHESQNNPGLLRDVEKDVFLRMLDQLWKDHLHALDHLRTGINLRAYAQKDPLNEYKQEAFSMFTAMLDNLKETIISVLSHVRFTEESQKAARDLFSRPPSDINYGGKELHDGNSNRLMSEEEVQMMRMIPRNAPCPCGSSLKYKHCHGKISE